MGGAIGDTGNESGTETFKLSLVHIYRPSRERITLNTIMQKDGYMQDGKCLYKDDAVFRELEGSAVVATKARYLHSDEVVLDFQEMTALTEISVTLGAHDCAALVVSTGRPCCVFNFGVKIFYPSNCRQKLR